ncbi:uncharacterized protein LOC107818518 isoform X2 [Nicotiana tabacum]|uniref:Uncharacterized protein LOC107818518 isoform X2 n=3 Tax=Nicotiana TaxID=4085 RepID=A0AC58RSP5_TOBAC|nr:PREDICTED: uncharacterized protein LOC104240633 isoform X2 [Nicotiana sylvestris]XP_016500027.1 PREDICTED: uncharacterized protein LOC107818518 isoform X2 [Nicotiana tabacum]
MARKRGRTCKKSQKITKDAQEKHQVEKEDDILINHEVERQSAAIRAIRDVETEQLLTQLCLLRSNFNEEQLQIPVMQFFRENLPNLAVTRKEDGTHEVKWKEADDNLSIDQLDGRYLPASLLQQLSMAYPACSNAIPSFGGFGLSSKSVKATLFGAENMEIKQFVLEEPSDAQMFELQDTHQTPGVNNNQLSVGMTPKTLRLPKTGEVLLSVHDSPLGVYKEDNMEPIHDQKMDEWRAVILLDWNRRYSSSL